MICKYCKHQLKVSSNGRYMICDWCGAKFKRVIEPFEDGTFYEIKSWTNAVCEMEKKIKLNNNPIPRGWLIVHN